VSASRTIAAPAQQLWEVIVDPHHLPRWWPRVTRVEDVEGDAFTEVMTTRKGTPVRADFDVVARDEAAHVVRWAQRVEGTPFERVLSAAETEVRLTPLATQAEATAVTIELRQVLRGFVGANMRITPPARFGSFMVRRAATATLEEALAGLERISV
jgi:uncharacterized protein YndB with AHSA1/START domain